MLQWMEHPGENVILVIGNHDEEFACYADLMTAIYELPFNHGKVYRVYDEKADCAFYDLDCGWGFKESNPEASVLAVCGWRMKKFFTFKTVETAENDGMLLIGCGP